MSPIKFTIAALALAIGTLAAQANQTNLVENLQLRLAGLSQGVSTTNRNGLVVKSAVESILETRQVLQTLGTATGHTFSTAARLVLVTPLNGSPGSVEVRDHGNKFVVTGYFLLEQTGVNVTSSVLNPRNGQLTQINYSIQHFILRNAAGLAAINLHFDVNGFGSDFYANHDVRGPDNSLQINVSGNGDRNGVPLVIQGQITISGQTLEVVDDGVFTGTS